MKTKDKIIVGFVWCLIIFQWFSLMYLFLPQLFIQNIIVFLIQAPIFNLVVLMICINYYKSNFYSPGSPTYIKNVHYQQELEDLKNYSRRQADLKKQRRKNKKKGKIDLQQIKALNQVSFCFKCDVVKQQRVHHCSICRKCIIRMDHHCPWVGNCVGKFNHKYFILFLFYATTGLSMVAISFSIDIYQGKSIMNTLSESQKIWAVISCVTSYLLALSIGFLFVTQMITSCQNITTLQSFTQGVSEHNPWQKGSIIENLRQIFGQSNWMLPTQPFSQIHGSTTNNLQVVI